MIPIGLIPFIPYNFIASIDSIRVDPMMDVYKSQITKLETELFDMKLLCEKGEEKMQAAEREHFEVQVAITWSYLVWNACV